MICVCKGKAIAQPASQASQTFWKSVDTTRIECKFYAELRFGYFLNVSNDNKNEKSFGLHRKVCIPIKIKSKLTLTLWNHVVPIDRTMNNVNSKKMKGKTILSVFAQSWASKYTKTCHFEIFKRKFEIFIKCWQYFAFIWKPIVFYRCKWFNFIWNLFFMVQKMLFR